MTEREQDRAPGGGSGVLRNPTAGSLDRPVDEVAARADTAIDLTEPQATKTPGPTRTSPAEPVHGRS